MNEMIHQQQVRRSGSPG